MNTGQRWVTSLSWTQQTRQQTLWSYKGMKESGTEWSGKRIKVQVTRCGCLKLKAYFQTTESHSHTHPKPKQTPKGLLVIVPPYSEGWNCVWINLRTTALDKLQKQDANVNLVILPAYMCLPGRKEKIGFGKRPGVSRKEKDS